MKNKFFIILLIVGLSFASQRFFAQGSAPKLPARYEYATVAFINHTQVTCFTPDGKTEDLRSVLDRVPKTSVDYENTFYMNVLLNYMASQGYDFHDRSGQEIYFRRATGR